MAMEMLEEEEEEPKSREQPDCSHWRRGEAVRMQVGFNWKQGRDHWQEEA